MISPPTRAAGGYGQHYHKHRVAVVGSAAAADEFAASHQCETEPEPEPRAAAAGLSSSSSSAVDIISASHSSSDGRSKSPLPDVFRGALHDDSFSSSCHPKSAMMGSASCSASPSRSSSDHHHHHHRRRGRHHCGSDPAATPPPPPHHHHHANFERRQYIGDPGGGSQGRQGGGGGGGEEEEEEEDGRESEQYVAARIRDLVGRLAERGGGGGNDNNNNNNMEARRSAARELRLLAKHDDAKRAAIFEAGAVGPLLELMTAQGECGRPVDAALQHEATTALLNLSLNERIRGRVAGCDGALEAVLRVLSRGASPAATENAAAALVSLAGRDEQLKAKLGSMGAVPPLLELLHGGSERGRKDAAAALYCLSSADDNKRRMVRGAATGLLLRFVSDPHLGMLDKSMAILRNLVGLEEGRVAFVAEGGVEVLLDVLRRPPPPPPQQGLWAAAANVGGNNNIAAAAKKKKSQELALLILFQLCRHSSKHRSIIVNLDPLPSLTALLETTSNPKLKLQVYEVIKILEEHKVSMVKQLMGSRQRPYHHRHHHHQAAAGEVYSV